MTKTLEELRHCVTDVLDVASLSDAQMLQTLLRKVNGGATMKLLLAALSVARERESNRIAELVQELEDTERDLDELGDALRRARNALAEHEQTGRLG
jgi:hypothetical protein